MAVTRTPPDEIRPGFVSNVYGVWRRCQRNVGPRHSHIYAQPLDEPWNIVWALSDERYTDEDYVIVRLPTPPSLSRWIRREKRSELLERTLRELWQAPPQLRYLVAYYLH
jgi:hypothetical protein